MKKLFFLMLLLGMYGCPKTIEPIKPCCPGNCCTSTDPYLGVKQVILDTMRSWYLWNEDLPATVDTAKYNKDVDPYMFLDSMRNSKDKISVLINRSDLPDNLPFFGFLPAIDSAGNLRVAYIYISSSLYNNGVRRGWTLKKIDGQDFDLLKLLITDKLGISKNFTFEDLEGASHTLSSVSTEIDPVYVIESSILTVAGKNVGFIATDYLDAASVQKVKDVFDTFVNEQVDEIVVDLRYDQGGWSAGVTNMAGSIAGNSSSSQILTRVLYNDKHTILNTYMTIPSGLPSPEITRVFFITNRLTYVTGEMIINGLKPLMNVEVVGDSTLGCPNGQAVFEVGNYLLYLAAYKFANKDGITDYFDGLPADFYVADNFLHSIGDPEEPCLKAILSKIETGAYPASQGRMGSNQNPSTRVIKQGMAHYPFLLNP